MNYTMEDVAKRANVSIATVSRILNNQTGYSEKTKKKVLEVIEDMGYQVNNVARGLVTKSSHTIGVILPSLATMISAEILSGIEDYAHEIGYSVVICNTGVNGIKVPEYIKILQGKQIDGIINISINIADEEYERIKKSNIPCVLVCMQSFKHQLPYVKVDDYQAAYTATKYLIDKGHKKIAMISGPEDDKIAGAPRLEGYKHALLEHGIQVEEQLIKIGQFSYEEGVKCMEELIKEGQVFTAVFAVSDDLAVGALQVANKHGLQVPKDLSIMGYDNTLIARMAIPPLTVLAQPLYEMGTAAAKNLIKLIQGEEIIVSTILPHSVVERNTVKEWKEKSYL